MARRLTFRLLLALTCSMVLLATGASASVVTLFSAYVPLLDPQGGVRVERVMFRSAYAQPESTLAAATWPYRVNTAPGEEPAQDVNLASVLGLKLDCSGLKSGGRVTIDVSAMKPLPADLHKQWPRLTRADVLKALIVATDRNLKLCAIHDCRLVVKGVAKHEDLRTLRLPAVLNPRPAKAENSGGDGDD